MRARSLPFYLLILCIGVFSACSKQSFKVGSFSTESQSPGLFSIPSKVDILLAEDNSGSMYEAFAQVSAQLPGFLDRLEQHGWNYRFATTPLITQRPLDQILAAKFDGNWASSGQWQPPFPGAQANALPNVLPQFFTLPNLYTGFIDYSDISNTSNAYEPGFDTIKHALIEGTSPASGFIRPDAMLIVLVLSNGNDSSGVNFCTRSDGWVGPCEGSPSGNGGCQTCTSPTSCVPKACTGQSSFNGFLADFQALETQQKTADVRFFSAVAFQQQSHCLGSSSFIGARYRQMATALGGQSYDICNQPLANALDSLESDLAAIKTSFRTKYLVIGEEPNEASIQVVRYVGGNPDNQVVIQQDPNNGWTYAGLTTQFTIDSPIPMNQATGYMVELHGTAKLTGADSAVVNFTPINGQNSSN